MNGLACQLPIAEAAKQLVIVRVYMPQVGDHRQAESVGIELLRRRRSADATAEFAASVLSDVLLRAGGATWILRSDGTGESRDVVLVVGFAPHGRPLLAAGTGLGVRQGF